MPQFRLKSRNRPIPNGLTMKDPRTRYEAPQHASFDAQVQGLLQSRRGNPGMVKRYNLSLDQNVIEDEVDAYLAKVCADNRWDDFYIRSDAINAPPIFPEQVKKNLTVSAGVAGVKTILDMMGPEGPVDHDLAEKRAVVCVACPKHEKGSWESLFTVPIAHKVRGLIGLIHKSDLHTSHDAELRVCGVCQCPCETKVHARLSHISAHIPAEDYAELPSECWIKTEQP